MIFDKEILTVPEVSYFLACSQQTIYNLIHTGKLEAYKGAGQKGRRGRVWKITAFSLEYYLRSMVSEYDPKKFQTTIEKNQSRKPRDLKTVRKNFLTGRLNYEHL